MRDAKSIRTAKRHIKDYTRRVAQLNSSELYEKINDVFISKTFKAYILQILDMNMFKDHLKNKTINQIVQSINIDKSKLHRGKNIQTISVNYNRCCNIKVDVIIQTFKLNPDTDEYSYIAVIVEGKAERDQYASLVKLPPRKQYKKKVVNIKMKKNIDTLSVNMFALDNVNKVVSFPNHRKEEFVFRRVA